MVEFSHDTIIEILSRLPAKSICRFRCVSKTWLHLTHDPHFVATHLSRHQKQNIIFAADSCLFSLDKEAPIDDEIIPSELDFPLKGDSDDWDIRIIGSGNGLICISPQQNTFFVFNPSTRESTRIPDCPLLSPVPILERTSLLDLHAFGFVPSAKDYKFLTIHNARSMFSFSLKNKSWKTIQDFPYKKPKRNPGVFLNGVVHWLCMGPHIPIIAALDLAEEKFSWLYPPEYVTRTTFHTIGVVREHLCLLLNDGFRENFMFWTMNDYGVKDSWTGISIVMPFFSLLPLSYEKTNKVLVAINNTLKTCRFKLRDVLGNDFPVPFHLDMYVESLVSPNIWQN